MTAMALDELIYRSRNDGHERRDLHLISRANSIAKAVKKVSRERTLEK